MEKNYNYGTNYLKWLADRQAVEIDLCRRELEIYDSFISSRPNLKAEFANFIKFWEGYDLC